MINKVLTYVRERLAAARQAPPTDYREGSINELEEIEDFILDLEWEEGIDEDM